MTEELNAISQEFRDRLFALLREYNVEMQVEEEMQGYDNVVTGVNFFSYSVYDEATGKSSDSINFTLGTWEDGKKNDG